jgi:hypothetical protein
LSIMQRTKSGNSKSFTSDTNLSRTMEGYVTYRYMHSDWYWIYSPEIRAMTDYYHWKHFSTGRSLNPSCELVLSCLLWSSFFWVLILRLTTGTHGCTDSLRELTHFIITGRTNFV